MDDPNQVTNETIRFTFPCCENQTHLTYGDLGQLVQGESCQCPECSELAVLKNSDRNAMNRKLEEAARKGKLITGFSSLWFAGGLVLYFFYGATVMLPFFGLGALIGFGLMQGGSGNGKTEILLEKPAASV